MLNKFRRNFYKQWHNSEKSSKVFYFALLLAFGWLLFSYLRFPRQSWVDGLLESWWLSKGLVMYRDFSNEYFPLLFMIMVPFHKIFGFSQIPTMYLAPATSLFTFFLLAFVGHRWLRGWARMVPFLFFAFWDPILLENHFTTASFHSIVNLSAFIIWWSWYRNPKKIKALFLGLFLSFGFLSLQMVVFFTVLVFISILYKTLREKKDIGYQHLILSLIGFLLPCFLIGIWLIKTGAFPAFYYWNIVYYLSGTYPYSVLGKSARDTRFYFFIFSPILLFFTPLVYKIGLYLKSREKIIAGYPISQIFFATLIVISLPVSFWFAIFHPSRFYMAMSMLALVFGIGIDICNRELKSKKTFSIILSTILLLNLFTLFKDMIPIYQRYLARPKAYRILDKTPETDPMAKAERWIIKNTPQDAKLFVTESSLFYFEANRLPSGARATSALPNIMVPLDLLKNELINNPPDYWVIDERNWKRFENFGYKNVVSFFKKILSCEPVLVRFEYLTIMKHVGGSNYCF